MSTGRRNCKRCTRWKLDIEFRWRWHKRPGPAGRRAGKRRYDTPSIDNVCEACRRSEARGRYARLSAQEKAEKGRRANEKGRERRRKLEEQITRARMIHDRKDPEWNDKRVDLVPFRMWVLGQVRLRGSTQALARQAHLDEAQVRRWADGFDWDTNGGQSSWSCEPRPILTINVATVDAVGVALDDPGLLDRLYPFVDQLE